MRRKMSSKHNFWGGPCGPPGFVPIIDPGEVWADESLKSVCGLRLDRDALRIMQEAVGYEPLGRYGDFPDGSDYFWAFRSDEDLKAAMERGHAKLRELRPQPIQPEPAKPRPSQSEWREKNKLMPDDAVCASLWLPSTGAPDAELALYTKAALPFLRTSPRFRAAFGHVPQPVFILEELHFYGFRASACQLINVLPQPENFSPDNVLVLFKLLDGTTIRYVTTRQQVEADFRESQEALARHIATWENQRP